MRSVERRGRVAAMVVAGLALTSIGAPFVFLQAAGAALLLTSHGVSALPLVYVGAAALLIPLGWLYLRAARAYGATQTLLAVLAVRCLAAAGLFAASGQGIDGFAYAAAIWARVDLVIGLTAFWRVAGAALPGIEDKRRLTWIAMCEPASALAAGATAPWAAALFGVETMFLVAAILTLAALPAAWLVRETALDAVSAEDEPRPQEMRRLAARSRPKRPLSRKSRRFVALAIGAMVIWTAAHYLVDAVFFGMVGDRAATPLGAFSVFSYALAAGGALGFVLAFIGRGGFIRRYGLRFLMTVAPLTLLGALALGGIGMTLFESEWPLFVAVFAVKAMEYALMSGYYVRAWRSLLAPIPETHRARAISRAEKGAHLVGAVVGAGALAALLSAGGFDATALSLAAACLVSVGLILSRFVQIAHADALERALSRRQPLDHFEVGAADRRSRAVVQRLLSKDAGGDALEAARMQAALDVDGFVNAAPRLIAKGDKDVVRMLVSSVPQVARRELYPPMAGRLIVEEDPALRDALLTAAAATGHPRSPRLLAKALADASDDPPAGALVGLGRHGGAYGAAVAGQFLERFALTGDAALAAALEATAAIGRGAPASPVALALRSEDPALRRRAIRAAGKIGDASLAPLLVEQLSDPREWRAATLALSALGAEAAPSLAALVGDRTAKLSARAAAILALGGIDAEPAREQVLLHAKSPDRRLRAWAHLALWRAGAVAPRDLAPFLAEDARAEMRDAIEAMRARAALAPLDDALLSGGLAYAARRAAMRAIRAAGLSQPRPPGAEARLAALFGFVRDWRFARGAAAAALPDDLLAGFRLVASEDEAADETQLAAYLGETEPLDMDARLAAIAFEARWASDWLRAVAYGRLAARRPEIVDDVAAADAPGDRGPILREMLETAAARRAGEGKMSLSTVEKVLILKSADLFAQVPDEDLAEIAPFLSPIYLDAGETIITQGEMGDELYIVVTGEVAVIRDGQEVARMSDRAVFGDLAALDPEPRAATVVATAPTQALVLANEHLLALFESNVEIAAGVIATLIRRLRKV